MLARNKPSTSYEQETWTASAAMPADAHQVLRALTEPASIARWAPVSFEVDGLAGPGLQAGSNALVTGSLAGIRVAFDVEVESADSDGLRLLANGPISLDVGYRFRYHREGLAVDATVALGPTTGLKAQVLRRAVAALLNAGALGSALRRLRASLGVPADAELLAA